MAPVIADSSALVALMKDDDALHEQAVRAAELLAARAVDIIIPSEVFAETLNLLGKKVSNQLAVVAARALLIAPNITVVASSPASLQAAVDRLATEKNSTSFVDALVMACAEHYQTTEIFGFDDVFAANNFTVADNPNARRQSNA